MHQLVVIVSDGKFHEREYLVKKIRDLCNRSNTLVAYVILDDAKNSLVELSTVSFENGDVVFNKYLDSFLFPFYIVINDITALPSTLADLLRQWFQISTSF